MDNPWFGQKAGIGSSGILAWQGWLMVGIGIGGGAACHFLLKNDWAAAACAAALAVAFFLKYDPDSESY